MSKHKALGQDPFAWIKKTEDGKPAQPETAASPSDEGAAETASEAEEEAAPRATAAAPTDEVPSLAAAAREAERPTSSWPFLVIMAINFFLLLLLGYLGFTLLNDRLDDLSRRVEVQNQRVEQLEMGADYLSGRPKPALRQTPSAPAPPAPTTP